MSSLEMLHGRRRLLKGATAPTAEYGSRSDSISARKPRRGIKR